jgi:hypothetical protein
MPQNPTMAKARQIRQVLRDAISRGEPVPIMMPADSNCFRAWPLREIAKEAGIDENDPLLVRALEAQEKARPLGSFENDDWRTNLASWLWKLASRSKRRGHPTHGKSSSYFINYKTVTRQSLRSKSFDG